MVLVVFCENKGFFVRKFTGLSPISSINPMSFKFISSGILSCNICCTMYDHFGVIEPSRMTGIVKNL